MHRTTIRLRGYRHVKGLKSENSTNEIHVSCDTTLSSSTSLSTLCPPLNKRISLPCLLLSYGLIFLGGPLYRGSFRTRSIASVFSLLAKLADLSPSRNLFLGSQRTAIPGPSFSILSVLFPPPLSILTLFYPDRRRLPLSLPSFPFDVSVLLHAEAVSSTTWSKPPPGACVARPALSSGPIIFIANRLIRPLHFVLSRSRGSLFETRRDRDVIYSFSLLYVASRLTRFLLYREN